MMNKVEWNAFLASKENNLEVRADMFKHGTLMCGRSSNHMMIHVYREDGLIHRLEFDNDIIIKHDAKEAWCVNELCAASRHYIQTTDFNFACIVSSISDTIFNFNDGEIFFIEPSPLPTREQLKISVAKRDCVARIQGEFNNTIELIKDQCDSLKSLIEDAYATDSTKKELSFNGSIVPHYYLSKIRSHVLCSLTHGEPNYTFADLLLVIRSGFDCLKNCYLNACKREFVNGRFDENPNVQYAKDSFLNRLNEHRLEAHQHNEDCSLSTEFIDQVFNNIEAAADHFMSAK